MVRVLYVDDSKILLDITRRFLEMNGEISVDTTSSLENAATKIDSIPYDCIVTDYIMPAMKKFDLLKHVREKGIQTPFIFFMLWKDYSYELYAEQYRKVSFVPKNSTTRSPFWDLYHEVHRAGNSADNSGL